MLARRCRRAGRVRVRPSAFSCGGELADAAAARRRRPCRARARGRRSSRAPPRSRTRRPSTRPIHLKPVSVSAYGCPAAAAIRPSSDEDTIEVGVGAAARPRRSRWCGEQRADLVAAQHPPAVRRPGRPTAQRSASGSLATTRSAPRSRGQRHREVHRARLLGVGERDGREVRVGLLLLGRRRAARRSRRVSQDLRAPTCRRRRAAACRRCRGRAGRRRRGRRPCRGSGRRCPRRAIVPASPRGTSASGADRGDPRGDLGVGRRHDLAAVAEVDLVAVVLRRVVAGGDHHAGDAAELADREGQQRGGQRPRAARSALKPGAGHHLGGVAGEDVGVVAGVVPDHDDGRRRRRRGP